MRANLNRFYPRRSAGVYRWAVARPEPFLTANRVENRLTRGARSLLDFATARG